MTSESSDLVCLGCLISSIPITKCDAQSNEHHVMTIAFKGLPYADLI
jgi:predicted aconitase with swiveling domain